MAFGRGYGRWPGRGPFSYLPPWQRPGWIYGRGACWWFLNPNLTLGYAYQSQYATPYVNPNLYNATYQQPGSLTQNFPVVQTPSMPPDQELQYLENYRRGLDAEMKDLEEELRGVEARINELKKSLQHKQQGP
ncbi:MAG: hypothetical protein ACPLN2_06160 [Thermoproteota archaeon]